MKTKQQQQYEIELRDRVAADYANKLAFDSDACVTFYAAKREGSIEYKVSWFDHVAKTSFKFAEAFMAERAKRVGTKEESEAG